MKKFFMSLAAVAVMALAAGFVSCDPNKAQCWKLVVTFQNGATQIEYFYGTGVEADVRLESFVKTGGVKSTHREQAFLSQENCHK